MKDRPRQGFDTDALAPDCGFFMRTAPQVSCLWFVYVEARSRSKGGLQGEGDFQPVVRNCWLIKDQTRLMWKGWLPRQFSVTSAVAV